MEGISKVLRYVFPNFMTADHGYVRVRHVWAIFPKFDGQFVYWFEKITLVERMENKWTKVRIVSGWITLEDYQLDYAKT